MLYIISKLFKSPILVFSIIILLPACTNNDQENKAAPPTIQVVEVMQKDVPIYNYFVGQVYGQEDININARVEGFLTGIHFEEGSRVNKGSLLYTIDPEPFKASVASSKSKVAEAQTILVNAENELARYKPLAEIDAVSQSDLDFKQANRDAAIASVEAAKASLRISQINLSYTRVKSPVTGFIGKTQARIGEFVGRSPNPVILNTVSTIESIRVHFFITETEYLILAKSYSVGNKKRDEDVKEDRTPRLELILSDGSTHPFKGRVDFINREVDSETGAMLVQATFPNPNLILRPGQFSRVKVKMLDEIGALLVPQRCVTELQGQFSVFVVNAENIIEARQIKISEKYSDYYIVSEGLQPKDKIVLEGLQKVGSGMEVVPEITEFESQTIDQ